MPMFEVHCEEHGGYLRSFDWVLDAEEFASTHTRWWPHDAPAYVKAPQEEQP